MIALVLAQVLSTPEPIVTPTQPPISERAVLEDRVDRAVLHAKTLGATLGVVVIDMATGAMAARNAQTSLPMASVQKLPLAIVTYDMVDRHKLTLDARVTIEPGDLVAQVSPIAQQYAAGKTTFTVAELLRGMIENSDNTAAKALMRTLGGIDALNATMHEDGFDTILLGADDDGFASPSALALLLSQLANGKMLSSASRAALLDDLARSQTFPGRLRAGFPSGTRVAHKTGTSRSVNGSTSATNDVGIVTVNGRTMIVVAMLHDAKGNMAARDAVLADVARAAYEASQLFPIQ